MQVIRYGLEAIADDMGYNLMRMGRTTIIKEIQEHVKKKLAAHEYPREIEFIDEFPVTVTGKVKRRDLREREEQRRKAQK